MCALYSEVMLWRKIFKVVAT